VQRGVIFQALRRAGKSYVQAFNLRRGRCGTLWQGGFNSSLVDSDAYALRVTRYIGLNPVRAAMVERPDHYRWSSAHTHLGTAQDPLLSPHPVYLALVADPDGRAAASHRWLNAPLDPEEIARIRAYMAQGRALGEPCFQAMVEKALNRPARLRSHVRPPLRRPNGSAAGSEFPLSLAPLSSGS